MLSVVSPRIRAANAPDAISMQRKQSSRLLSTECNLARDRATAPKLVVVRMELVHMCILYALYTHQQHLGTRTCNHSCTARCIKSLNIGLPSGKDRENQNFYHRQRRCELLYECTVPKKGEVQTQAQGGDTLQGDIGSSSHVEVLTSVGRILIVLEHALGRPNGGTDSNSPGVRCNEQKMRRNGARNFQYLKTYICPNTPA